MVNHRKQTGNARSDGPTQASHNRIHDTAEQFAGNHPVSYVAACFGIGLGIGVVIGSMLAESPSMFARHESTAERLGRNVLDAVSGVLPQQLATLIHR